MVMADRISRRRSVACVALALYPASPGYLCLLRRSLAVQLRPGLPASNLSAVCAVCVRPLLDRSQSCCRGTLFPAPQSAARWL